MHLSASCSGNGIPLLFLHAFPLNRRMWEAQISELSGKYQVIAPDLPYFGESTLAEYGNNSNSMEGCADAVSGLLDEMNLSNKVICGISMGGYIAFELWRKYPQKINALILADTRAE